MKKMIIFGAGNFGKRALSFYGKNDVFCFVDNNIAKVGQYIEGKKIISFVDMLKISSEYKIIIATARNIEIKKQLDENGISDYVCYTPSYEHL